MDEKLLRGKVVVITGASGLIGKAFCFSAAEHGASLAVLDIDGAATLRLAIQLQKVENAGEIICPICDVTSENSVKEKIVSVVQQFGRIDVLVNCAYPRNRNYGRKFEDVTYADFSENVSTHLGGYFLMSREVAKIMKSQMSGNIINMGSIYGFSAPKFEIYEGTDMTTPVEYSAIKGGVINLTRYLASYLAKYNIRVNSISPGGVFNNQPESFVKNYSSNVPLGHRMATQQDLLGAFIFLASDMSLYMTGQNLVVDGGFTL